MQDSKSLDRERSKPDRNFETDSTNNPSARTEINAGSDTQKINPGDAPASQTKPSVSEARLRANRNNAKKSTGPKTARGKAHSRRNALKHALTSKFVMFAADGTPVNDDVHQLSDRLHEKYDYNNNDVLTDLLVDTVLVEFWRLGKALNHEIECFENPNGHFSQLGNMANLQRYRTASQRALEKSLDLLEKLSPPSFAGCREKSPA